MILVDLRHLPAGPFCRPAQLVLLVGRGLVLRRYPQIDRSAFHGFAPLRTDEQAITVARNARFYEAQHDSISEGFFHTLSGQPPQPFATSAPHSAGTDRLSRPRLALELPPAGLPAHEHKLRPAPASQL